MTIFILLNRIANIIEEERENVKNDKRLKVSHKLYSQFFAALISKKIDGKNKRTNFRDRTFYRKNTTFNKIIGGQYANIEKIAPRILLRICIGLLLTYDESCALFYVFNQNLEDRNNNEMIICKQVIKTLGLTDPIEDKNEEERQDLAINNLRIANDMFVKNKLQLIENKEVLEDLYDI